MRADAAAAERPLPPHIRLVGNDVHPGAIKLAQVSARTAGVHHLLELSNQVIIH